MEGTVRYTLGSQTQHNNVQRETVTSLTQIANAFYKHGNHTTQTDIDRKTPKLHTTTIRLITTQVQEARMPPMLVNEKMRSELYPLFRRLLLKVFGSFSSWTPTEEPLCYCLL